MLAFLDLYVCGMKEVLLVKGVQVLHHEGVVVGLSRPNHWFTIEGICVGTSLIGWLDDNHTLPHGFSVPATSNKQYGHAHY